MNAQRPAGPEFSLDPPMASALVKSTLFHVLIFIVTLISFPFVQKDPIIVTPVSVELVDISDVTQAQKPPPKPKPIEKPKEPEVLKPPPEELKKPEKIEEVKEPDPVPLPEPEEKKEVEKPQQKPKPKPKPVEKPKPKEEPKQEDLFQSLLKDLTPAENEDQNQASQQVSDVDDGQDAPLAQQMSISELDALRRQIEPCWNVPTGVKYAEELIVTLRLSMNRDMTVRDVRVVDRGRYNRDSAFRAAADSAVRAVRNPRCSPFKLPPDKYDQWKAITINFDPSAML